MVILINSTTIAQEGEARLTGVKKNDDSVGLVAGCRPTTAENAASRPLDRQQAYDPLLSDGSNAGE